MENLIGHQSAILNLTLKALRGSPNQVKPELRNLLLPVFIFI